MNILLLFGGQSNEHEVSLVSASYILKALLALQHNVYPVAVHKNGVWELSESNSQQEYANIHNMLYIPDSTDATVLENTVWTIPAQGVWVNIPSPRKIAIDCVFPIIHGYAGEDGFIQGQLEIAQLLYTGCDTKASAICMNKHLTKFILEYFDIPITPSIILYERKYRDNISYYIKQCEHTLHYPMIIKPSDGGSSLGIAPANDKNELEQAIKQAFVLCSILVIEPLFHNIREIETAVINIGDTIKTFAPGEIIIPSKQIYDYTLKYKSNETYTAIPARLDSSISEQIEGLSKEVFFALGCQGFARIDFFLTEDNIIYVNEVNTIPGFTPISMFPKIVNQEMSTGALLTAIINKAIE